MFLIAPKDESSGEAVLSVVEARKMKAKWEAMNRVRPNAHNALNLACIYYTLGMGHEALAAANGVWRNVESLDGAVPPAIKANILFNRGMFLRGFGRIKEAREDIERAWGIDKSSAYMGMAMAEEHLRAGEWEKGWFLHNQVRGTCEGAAMACGLPQTCEFWDGKTHPKHLTVINEGGAGDRINYTRWLPELTKRGIDWSFFCFDELKPFYDRLPWIGPERTIGESDKKEFSPPPSHWTTVFALPGPLGINPAAIPGFPSPYTAPDNDFRLDKPDNLPIIALCWSANELFQGGLKVRSITEGQAMRLVTMTADKVHWVNLQHGHKMPYPVQNIGFDSWQDTATLIRAVDAVVTVDCGTLWLSTAMGKETAVILTACEDWKFGSHWDKEMTLYRNGESTELFDAERAINSLVFDIRKGAWPCH